MSNPEDQNFLVSQFTLNFVFDGKTLPAFCLPCNWKQREGITAENGLPNAYGRVNFDPPDLRQICEFSYIRKDIKRLSLNFALGEQ